MPTVPIRNFRDLAAVIKATREQRGVRQEDLANDLGMSRVALYRIESGTAPLVVSRLFRILRKLGITLTVTYTVQQKDASRD